MRVNVPSAPPPLIILQLQKIPPPPRHLISEYTPIKAFNNISIPILWPKSVKLFKLLQDYDMKVGKYLLSCLHLDNPFLNK